MASENPLKILHLSHSDLSGGAAKAAYRIHTSLRSIGVESYLGVDLKLSDDWTVISPKSNFDRVKMRIRSAMATQLNRIHTTNNLSLHSSSFFNSRWLSYINKSNFDVVHLHWVGHEMLSIQDIGKINKPIVWTLHDMWPFCGAEHYATDFRWRDGYSRLNRDTNEGGFDINRWAWLRKKKHWSRLMHIVAPSSWLANNVRLSALLGGQPVSVIPYPIDLLDWQPVDKVTARNLLKLPNNVPIVLFGAMGGGKDLRKGFDLLAKSLTELHSKNIFLDLQVVIFGESRPKNPVNLGFATHYVGSLSDQLSLRILYSAADVMLVPSRQDNLPLTAIESFACGTPVVAYDIGGLSDIVDHKINGYLARQFDVSDFSDGVEWVLRNHSSGDLSAKVRSKALKMFNPGLVSQSYLEIYESMLKE